MNRLSLAPHRRDPFWDLEGTGARRDRQKRLLVRYVAWVLLIAVLALVVTHLPAIDPSYLASPEGKPVLAAGLFGLLGAAAILALARVRRIGHH
jgi:hypothetical protein